MRVPPTGTVTFLFTDIEGSTRLWERDEGAMRHALARHDRILSDAIEANGGFVFKTVGDAFCAAFSHVPHTLEAALSAQRTLHTEAWEEGCEIRARMAIHTGEADLRAAIVFNIGDVSMLEGDLDGAREIFEEALASARDTGNRQNVVLASANLGQIALLQGDQDRASALLRESLRLSHDLGHQLEAANCLEALAAVAGSSEQDARAGRFWGTAQAMREAAGATIPPADLGMFWPFLELSRARLGEASWREMLVEGRSLTVERAIALTPRPGDTDVPARGPAGA